MRSLYKKTFFPYVVILFFTLLTTVFIWLPFYLNISSIGNLKLPQKGLETIVANWDGPLYIIPAKTGYTINSPIYKEKPLQLSARYFPAHLPLYPVTIGLLANFMNYPHAMLFSTICASILFLCLFYYFVKKHKLSDHPLLLTSVLMVFWPRFLIVRVVGSPEPLFLLLLLISIFTFLEKKYLISGIAGALAVMTKTPAILLIIPYSLLLLFEYIQTKKCTKNALFLLLIPFGLFLVFYIYKIQLNDFFAYFHTGGVVPMPYPFSVFNQQAKWVGTAWLEDIIFIFFFYVTAGIYFITSKSDLFKRLGVILLTFLGALMFVEHRDISRYGLLMLPLATIAYEKFLTDKRFITALVILLPAIYLYALNFIIQNTAPITNWAPFL